MVDIIKNKKVTDNACVIAKQDFDKFTSGVLGKYTGCIVTEICGTANNLPTLILYALITFLDSSIPLTDISELYTSEFVNKQRIKVAHAKFKMYGFGIKEYIVTCNDALLMFNELLNNKIWVSNNTIQYKNQLNLSPMPSKFVMVDDNNQIIMNKILRNNFFNGSYIIEFFDCEKGVFTPFFDNQQLLDQLSQDIGKYIPIDLSPIPDRLGSVIFQFPVIKTDFQIQNISKEVVQIHATPNTDNLSAIITSENDDYGVIDNYSVKNLIMPQDQMYLGEIDKIQPLIYDTHNNVIVHAKANTYYISAVDINSHCISSELPKIRKFNKIEVPLVSLHLSNQFTVGNPSNLLASKLKWMKHRNYIENTKKIIDNLEFKQFHAGESEEAIKFIRSIINKYGQKEIYLWDPYCITDDIVNTIFYSHYQNVIVKIITSDKVLGKSNFTNFKYKENKSLKEYTCENEQYLHIEYKIATGKFHDRFIICIDRDSKTRVWQLGSSINGLGKAHCIISLLYHPQPILDTFNTQWSELTDESLIWKI